MNPQTIVRKMPVHRHVLAFLDSSKIQYHTFTRKHVKPLSRSHVLRGLDVDSPLGEILDELR